MTVKVSRQHTVTIIAMCNVTAAVKKTRCNSKSVVQKCLKVLCRSETDLLSDVDVHLVATTLRTGMLQLSFMRRMIGGRVKVIDAVIRIVRRQRGVEFRNVDLRHFFYQQVEPNISACWSA